MKCPTFEEGTRCFVREKDGQKPSTLFWLCANHESPRPNRGSSPGTPACSSANVIIAVAYPSLPSCWRVPSDRHRVRMNESTTECCGQASGDNLQPPSACCSPN